MGIERKAEKSKWERAERKPTIHCRAKCNNVNDFQPMSSVPCEMNKPIRYLENWEWLKSWCMVNIFSVSNRMHTQLKQSTAADMLQSREREVLNSLLCMRSKQDGHLFHLSIWCFWKQQWKCVKWRCNTVQRIRSGQTERICYGKAPVFPSHPGGAHQGWVHACWRVALVLGALYCRRPVL